MISIKPTVVGIDNSPSMKKIFEKSAQSMDIDLIIIDSCREALSYLKSNTPDLIILSILLPDQNGMTLLRELRQLPMHKKTKIVIVSSKDYAQDRVMAKSLGVLEFISKPMPIKAITDIMIRYTQVD